MLGLCGLSAMSTYWLFLRPFVVFQFRLNCSSNVPKLAILLPAVLCADLFCLQAQEAGLPIEPDISQAWVRAAGANIREGPGTDFPRLRVLRANTPVQIRNRRGEWCEISFSFGEDALHGWIYAPLLSDRHLTETELNALQTPERSSGDGLDGFGARSLPVVFLTIMIGGVAYKLYRSRKAANLERRITQKATEIVHLIQRSFRIEPCPRCHEFENRLNGVSPNARSIRLECTTCRRKYWAPAISPDGYKLGSHYNDLLSLESQLGALRKSAVATSMRFEVPKGPMPFEQTTREPIPESVRATVWRRYSGACVQCGSKEHLQFDHIIPVSKGGTTSTANLQLLCRACNLKKTNVI